jgi:WD40 repeat protein
VTIPSNTSEGQSEPDLPTIIQPGSEQEGTRSHVASNSTQTSSLTIPGYDLMPEIAQGGMGVVYAARDRTFDREVAIKIMKPGMDAKQFNREARITACLPHPGIPPVYALGAIADGRPYLAMKLVRGDTLNKVLKSHADVAVDRSRLIAIFEQVCHAVGYAHAQGIVHRDLKPPNIMVGAFGEVQVMDWGLAKEIAGTESDYTPSYDGRNVEDMAATIAGQIKGTPAYMAPEQARGEPVDARADVFALAGILAAILTGHPPFSGNSAVETLIRAGKADLKEIFERLDQSGADTELLELCKRNLSPEPDDRCRNATEFALAVAEYRAEVEERLRRAERERAAAQAKKEEIRKHRKVRLALAASVLLLAIVGTFGAVVSSFWRIAELAKNEALTSKVAVERERERVARIEYGRAIEAAHHNVELGKFAEAVQLLESADAKFRGWEWNYMHRLLNSQRFLAQDVQAADLSQDGTRIAVCQNKSFRTASVWDTRSKQKIFASQDSDGFGQLVRNGVSFFPDGERVITTIWESESGRSVAWDIASGRELFRIPVKDIFAATLTADGTRLITRDIKLVTVRDAASGRLVAELPEPDEFSSELVANHDGSRIVIRGKGEGSWRLVHTETANSIPLEGHRNSIQIAAFSRDGSILLTVSDGETFVRDPDSGAVKFQVDCITNTDSISAICVSDDGQFIAYGDYKNRVVLWNVAKRQLSATLTGHTSPVGQITFTRDGKHVVSGSRDATVRIWNIETGKVLYRLCGHVKPIDQVTVSEDGSTIFTLAHNEARVWDLQLQPDVEFSELSVEPGPGCNIEWKGYRFGNLRVLPIGNGFGFSYPSGVAPEQFPQEVAFSNGDDVVAVVFKDGSILVWDCTAGKARTVIEYKSSLDKNSGKLQLRISPDGARVLGWISGKDDASVWDSTTGAKLFSIPQSSISAAEFSPDGTQIATGSYADGRLRIWSPATGVLIKELAGPDTRSMPVQTSRILFDENGHYVAAGMMDHSILLWDLTQNLPPLVLKGHTDEISSLAFTPDGTRLSSGSKDHTARIWDTISGAETFKISGGTDASLGILVRFESDGKRFLMSTDGEKFKVYNSNPISLPSLRAGD